MVQRRYLLGHECATDSRVNDAITLRPWNVTVPDTMQTATDDGDVVEFSIHGIVGIRFVNPTPRDIKTIIRPLRLTERKLTGKPDITVIFKKDFGTSALNRLGRHLIAYDNQSFYILDKAEHEVQARIPFDTVGYGCELIYKSDIGTAPLLADIINLIFLKKGYVHLHASAFLHNNNGILVTGWSNGGKSDMLLAFANHGAQYVADEFAMLSNDGSEMFGIPIAVTIWDWQFRYVDKLMPRVSFGRRLIHKVIHAMDFLYRAFAARAIGRLLPLSLLKKALPTLRDQLKIWVTPEVLFEGTTTGCRAAPQKLFLIMSHNNPDVVVTPCPTSEIARRMAPSNDLERINIYQYYKAFCFVFPDSRNEFIEKVDEQQSQMIEGALSGLEAYAVYHPHGLSFETLYEKLRPFCD